MSDQNEDDICLTDGSNQEQETKVKPATEFASFPKFRSKSAKKAEELRPAPLAAMPAPPPGLFKRVDINGFYPPFLKKLEAVLADCEAQGARYYVISGLRTAEEQNSLYAQGRSKPGPKVTNAKAYESMHQFYAAADMCRDADMAREGLQPAWKIEDYKILADTAKKHGLESAFFWKSFQEGPHVQLPLESRGITREALRDALLKGGKLGLFSFLDKYRW